MDDLPIPLLCGIHRAAHALMARTSDASTHGDSNVYPEETPSPTTERTNEQWLADLHAAGPQHAEALNDLRRRLERGVFFYLRSGRSDLTDYPDDVLRQMAQDFAQEALIKVLDRLETFRGESRFTTWAAKIAARIAVSELRRARYKDYSLEYLTAAGEMMPSITALAADPQRALSPEEQAERQEVLGIIKEALAHVLTERQRIALTAYVIDGVPIEEIARRMNTNRNALYKLLHDARLKLKRHMEARGLSLEYILSLFGA